MLLTILMHSTQWAVVYSQTNQLELLHISSSCIDHIYSNLPSYMLNNYIILAEISDHFGTYTKINSLPRKSQTKHVFVRKSNLNENEWKQFNAELADSLSHNIPYQHLLNPNYLSNAITDNYKTVIDKFMPEKKVKENIEYQIFAPAPDLDARFEKAPELLNLKAS